MSLIRFLLFLFLITPTYFIGFFFNRAPVPVIILLDPAGDGQHTGRQLNDGLERGLTLSWAQQLQKTIQVQNPGVTVLISRTAGQVVPPLSIAAYANRLPVDLYLRLQVYQETDSSTHVYIYRYSDSTDFVNATMPLVLHDQAFRVNAHLTREFSQLLKGQLDSSGHCICHGPYALRLQPLLGIAAPALMIDAGVQTVHTIAQHTQALAAALQPVIARIRTQKV